MTAAALTPGVGNTLRGMIDAEIELLGELEKSLLRQREAVAEGDRSVLDHSSLLAMQILQAIGVARDRRQSAVRELLNTDQSLSEYLETVNAPDTLVNSVTRLTDAAMRVTTETEINRKILQRSLDSTERFLRAVVDTAASQEPSYEPTGEQDASHAPVFLNRTA